MLKDNKVLVIGGAGFIGSHLVNRLFRGKCREIIVFDKYIRPDKFQSAGSLKILEGEITQVERLKEIMPGVDYVFHMAVLPLVACTENPRACLETNVNGTFNVIEAARDAGVKKIVFSSASSVYGDTEQTTDEGHPLNARTMYGASKIAGEYFLRAFYDMYKLDYVILRYMNVYGPGQEDGLIANTLKRVKDWLRPVIFGDGSQSFDFVYVDDVVEANILAMEKEVSDEAFNIGGENEISVREFVFLLLELTNPSLTPEFRPEEDISMWRRVGSSEKARRLLGYIPKVSLAEGLKRVIEAEFSR